MADLARLTKLRMSGSFIEEGGWGSLSPQLRHLGASSIIVYGWLRAHASLAEPAQQQVPAAFRSLTQLTHLQLDFYSMDGGWQFLPPSLIDLKLTGLRQVPPEMAALAALTELKLCFDPRGPTIERCWERLPQQLQGLVVVRESGLSLQSLPAELQRRQAAGLKVTAR